MWQLGRKTLSLNPSKARNRYKETTMSIVQLTVCLLAVYGLSNLSTANGKPLSGVPVANKAKNGEGVDISVPMPQFQPLDADWLSRLQGGDFHEVKDDGGRGGDSQSDTSVKPTTSSSLGFDFNYLFDKEAEAKKTSNENNWVKPTANNNQESDMEKDSLKDNALFDQFQKLFGTAEEVKKPQHSNEMFGQNQNGFGFDNAGFQQGSIQPFGPLSLPFPQVPNFLSVGQRGYSAGHRGQMPMFGGRGYSGGFGFAPLPPLQFFNRGFGHY